MMKGRRASTVLLRRLTTGFCGDRLQAAVEAVPNDERVPALSRRVLARGALELDGCLSFGGCVAEWRPDNSHER